MYGSFRCLTPQNQAPQGPLSKLPSVASPRETHHAGLPQTILVWALQSPTSQDTTQSQELWTLEPDRSADSHRVSGAPRPRSQSRWSPARGSVGGVLNPSGVTGVWWDRGSSKSSVERRHAQAFAYVRPFHPQLLFWGILYFPQFTHKETEAGKVQCS